MATADISSTDGSPREAAVEAYKALSLGQARNYDRQEGISPGQLVILLEVAERTGANLGQALATGEYESAHTWNDHIRPPLPDGSLGSATGVWQFQPATFHRIIKKFGTELLAASAADEPTGRPPMDLGSGPFGDAQVRRLIQETVDGRRSADDEELRLLRHNFAVLAFAKHYLTLDSGATTPEEDYLFHFLGEGEGRRILALARGEARNTLCVKPGVAATGTLLAAGGAGAAPQTLAAVATRSMPVGSSETPARPPVDLDLRRSTGRGPPIAARKKPTKKAASAQKSPPVSASGLVLSLPGAPGMPPVSLHLRQAPDPGPAADTGGRVAMRPASARSETVRSSAEPAVFYPLTAEVLPTVPSSDWGLPADSPSVTSNLGMFYRDGKGQSQPYTWAEFLDHLGRCVRAPDQPALVRAKYGVGFPVPGGDMPEWTFDPEQISEPAEFGPEQGRPVQVPERLVTGTLTQDETRRYQQRLAELVSRGDAAGMSRLPPEALSALHRLGVLPAEVQDTDTANPQVQQALRDFRKRVGKVPSDDPEHAKRLTPAERVALEIYGERLAGYARLQADQHAASDDALDLQRLPSLPAALQRSAAPSIAALQTALADRGLLSRPTKKTVWRDKKRKKHTAYQTVPFPGKADKATVAALNTFQLRHGLWRTEGVLDPITLGLLDLPPMGLAIFQPAVGPECPLDGGEDALPMCEAPIRPSWGDLRLFVPTQPRSTLWSRGDTIGANCWGPSPTSSRFGPVSCGT